VIQRRTQTPAYWGETFVIDEGDLETISTLFLEEETPLSSDELALGIIRRRTRQEELALQRMLSKGTLYQPQKHYEIGQEVVFPGLGFAVGTVRAERAGNNPEYGAFKVITVEFEGGKRTRDFAAELTVPHRLGAEGAEEGAPAAGEGGLLGAEELLKLYGAGVREKLETRLRALPDFVRLAGKWFLRSLLVDVNPGHLNIAEAILDVNGGGPLPTEALLRDLDLPAGVNRNLQVFSLNYAMQHDARFDEVGPSGEVQWFLRRLEPQEVLVTPRWLSAPAEAVDRTRLNADELALVRELEDEWESDDLAAPAPAEVDPNGVTVTLTFPHRAAGTLPLTPRLARIFPTARVAPRVRLTLIDAQNGERIPAWVVRAPRYVYGLGDLYRKYEIPAGAAVLVRPGDEPGTVLIDLGVRRPKREWLRVVRVGGHQLNFEMQKRQVGVAYDELMMLWVDDVPSLEPVFRAVDDQRKPLARVIAEVFPELAKLSAQSTVHARTLYSAVNLVRRSPVAPIIATLHGDPAYIAVGGNYWRFDEFAS
jgi:hypothetical protein